MGCLFWNPHGIISIAPIRSNVDRSTVSKPQLLRLASHSCKSQLDSAAAYLKDHVWAGGCPC